jgi:ligand-binding sensor domain-containing protein
VRSVQTITLEELQLEISGRAVCALVTVLVSLGNPALALDESQGTSSFVRKNFTVEDGLLSNVVHVVLQTRDGFLWVGTKEGLLRFDGRHFTPIDFLPQASPVSAVALEEAPDGALWVGTTGGLARIASGEGNESGQITSSMYHPGTGDADSIQCLHFSRSGDLYVGTIAGLYRFDHGRFVTLIPNLWTSRIEESSNGRLLVILIVAGGT